MSTGRAALSGMERLIFSDQTIVLGAGGQTLNGTASADTLTGGPMDLMTFKREK